MYKGHSRCIKMATECFAILTIQLVSFSRFLHSGRIFNIFLQDEKDNRIGEKYNALFTNHRVLYFVVFHTLFVNKTQV